MRTRYGPVMRGLGLIGAGLIGLIAAGGPAQAKGPDGRPKILLFSHTTGYRHASIEPGIAAIKTLGAREKLTIVASEDPAVFSADALKDVDAIVFLSSTTDPKKPESEWLQGSKREALQAFVHRGGGIVGIHAAADSHYHWPWYGKMIGGHFARHPQGTPTGTVTVVDAEDPTTAGLPKTIKRADEWYYFDDYDVTSKLLVTLDPASIGEKDVNPNPVSWRKQFEGARIFYTAMGHTNESFSDPNFLRHLTAGLHWALGQK
ncbi:ThuA domain-containing protein [Allosphingosinicella deserti]|uniref:Crp/Fnr family transcriptional regulator n=1 Tax=Allosphingosinicella deserti TaxID=2116704 RepID=A0A2P7QM19_9SPHN|nr:ThuA domain-containing protein [Sphingomonas deserti]PSJ39009.1 Crp/Fnr family transcriptional regulator [Sphingomonas deserti]